MEDLFVFTIATHDKGYLSALRESCEKNKIELHVAGMGQAWDGFGTKLRLIRETLDSVEEETVVLFTDAYDSIIVGTPSEILTRFRRFDTDVLFSGQSTSAINTFFFGTPCGKTMSLNSGGFIGKAGALRTMFDRMCSSLQCKASADDQRLINTWCKSNDIKLDVKSELFYVFDWETPVASYAKMMFTRESAVLPVQNKFYAIHNKRLTLQRTQTRPLVLHANGNASMDKILEAFGLQSVQIPRDYFKYSTGPFLTYLLIRVFLLLAVVVAVYMGIRHKGILFPARIKARTRR
jgi:hypothetical protein